jgi:hypothetical protein
MTAKACLQPIARRRHARQSEDLVIEVVRRNARLLAQIMN